SERAARRLDEVIIIAADEFRRPAESRAVEALDGGRLLRQQARLHIPSNLQLVGEHAGGLRLLPQYLRLNGGRCVGTRQSQKRDVGLGEGTRFIERVECGDHLSFRRAKREDEHRVSNVSAALVDTVEESFVRGGVIHYNWLRASNACSHQTMTELDAK